MEEYSVLLEPIQNGFHELSATKTTLEKNYKSEMEDFKRMEKADFLVGGVTTSLIFLAISVIIQFIGNLVLNELRNFMNFVIVVIAFSLVIVILAKVRRSVKECEEKLKEHNEIIDKYIEAQTRNLANIYEGKLNDIVSEKKILQNKRNQMAKNKEMKNDLKTQMDKAIIKSDYRISKLISTIEDLQNLIKQASKYKKQDTHREIQEDKVEKKKDIEASRRNLINETFQDVIDKMSRIEEAELYIKYLDEREEASKLLVKVTTEFAEYPKFYELLSKKFEDIEREFKSKSKFSLLDKLKAGILRKQRRLEQ
ncbi:MAG: hypothetical protein ACFFAO_02840 [Candidatus Hermodarchaeota archaeon]